VQTVLCTLSHTQAAPAVTCGPLLSFGLPWLSCGSDTHHTKSQFSSANESFIHSPISPIADHSTIRLGASAPAAVSSSRLLRGRPGPERALATSRSSFGSVFYDTSILDISKAPSRSTHPRPKPQLQLQLPNLAPTAQPTPWMLCRY